MKVKEQAQQRYYHFQTLLVFTHLVPPWQTPVNLQKGRHPTAFSEPRNNAAKGHKQGQKKEQFHSFFILSASQEENTLFTWSKYSKMLKQ